MLIWNDGIENELVFSSVYLIFIIDLKVGSIVSSFAMQSTTLIVDLITFLRSF